MKILIWLLLLGTLSAQQITEKQARSRKRWPTGQIHCNPGETTVFGAGIKADFANQGKGWPGICLPNGHWYGKEFEAWQKKDYEERQAWYRKVECERKCNCQTK